MKKNRELNQLISLDLQISKLQEQHERLYPVVTKNKQEHMRVLTGLRQEDDFKQKINALLKEHKAYVNMLYDHKIGKADPKKEIGNKEEIGYLKDQLKELGKLVQFSIDIRQGKKKPTPSNMKKLHQRIEECSLLTVDEREEIALLESDIQLRNGTKKDKHPDKEKKKQKLQKISALKTESIKETKPELEKRHKAQQRWKFIKDNLSTIAKLSPKGMTKPISSEYYKEVLSPDHLHLPFGNVKGKDILNELNQALSTGIPPERYKELRSENNKVSLYDVVKRSIQSTRGNKVQFFEEMYEAFSQSPDLEKKVIEENFSSVKYLTKEESTQYQVSIRNGVIYQGNSKIPFTTIDMLAKGEPQAAFVINQKGELFVGPHITGQFHHSSFLGGERVLAAGTIKVNEQGKITEVTNNSGHYKPEENHILLGLQSVPQFTTACHVDCKVNIFNDPLATGPESIVDFMKRVKPYAEKKAQEISKKESEYRQKVFGEEKQAPSKSPLQKGVPIQQSKKGELVKTEKFSLPQGQKFSTAWVKKEEQKENKKGEDPTRNK